SANDLTAMHRVSAMACAIPTATAIYHHAQPPRSLDVCSTAARGSRLRACAAVRCSCWWTASATPRRRRWPLTCVSAIPTCPPLRIARASEPGADVPSASVIDFNQTERWNRLRDPRSDLYSLERRGVFGMYHDGGCTASEKE